MATTKRGKRRAKKTAKKPAAKKKQQAKKPPRKRKPATTRRKPPAMALPELSLGGDEAGLVDADRFHLVCDEGRLASGLTLTECMARAKAHNDVTGHGADCQRMLPTDPEPEDEDEDNP